MSDYEMRTIGTLSLLAAGLLIGSCILSGANAAPAAEFGELATPPGITIEPQGRDQGYGFGGGNAVRDKLMFANAKGMTLYTSDADTAGKSVCNDVCAKDWLPALAPDKAKVFGPWSVITRDDKTKQWAYKGKPLYTSVKDVDIGSWYGNSPINDGPPRKNGAGVMVGREQNYLGKRPERTKETPLPDGWKIAMAFPISDIKLPTGIAIAEVRDALGLTLVDYAKRTLYYFDGDPLKNQRPNSHWVPAAAPQISQPIGDFKLVVRADGVRQWTYKGKGLYTFDEDTGEGFADGIGVDRQWKVANIYNYYVPSNISFTHAETKGKILATADGQTLYLRTPHSVGQTHGLRRSQGIRPAIGRELGTNVQCDKDCRKEWHPYPVPADANLPQGQWNVLVHPDGFKQITYQGFGLWTYDADKRPGQTEGDSQYTDFIFSGRLDKTGVMTPEQVDLGTPLDGPAALYWAVIQP